MQLYERWLIMNGWLCTWEGWLHPEKNPEYPLTSKQAIVNEYLVYSKR